MTEQVLKIDREANFNAVVVLQMQLMSRSQGDAKKAKKTFEIFSQLFAAAEVAKLKKFERQ